MAEAVTALVRLLVVTEIREDESGATLRFHQGDAGHLDKRDARYATGLRLAQRSQERQHPVGVSFGTGSGISNLIRADNDVPAQLAEEGSGRVRVLFQGHDGAFRLAPHHPEASRLRTVLEEACRQQARVWFVARKVDLTVEDALPVDGALSAPAKGNGRLSVDDLATDRTSDTRSPT